MDTIVDNATARLAARIIAERKERGWSPGELARRAGVSRAMIAKIESGQSSPTAMLLGKLSGAFGLTMSTLLARAEGGGSQVLRRAEQAMWTDPATRYERRQILPTPGSTLPVDLTCIELPPRVDLTFPASAYAFTRHVIWVQEGTLTFVEGAETHQLEAGDVLELGAPQECRFENRTRRPCRYAVLVLRVSTGQSLYMDRGADAPEINHPMR